MDRVMTSSSAAKDLRSSRTTSMFGLDERLSDEDSVYCSASRSDWEDLWRK